MVGLVEEGHSIQFGQCPHLVTYLKTLKVKRCDGQVSSVKEKLIHEHCYKYSNLDALFNLIIGRLCIKSRGAYFFF